jgi:hypothetical protein
MILDTQAGPVGIKAEVASLLSATAGTVGSLSLSPHVGVTPTDPQSQSAIPSLRSSTRTARKLGSFIASTSLNFHAEAAVNDLNARIPWTGPYSDVPSSPLLNIW